MYFFDPLYFAFLAPGLLLGLYAQWRVKRDFAAMHDGKAGPVKWIEHVTEDPYGMVNLNTAMGKANGVVAYGAAKVHSLKDQEVELRMGCICANKVWVNGELVISNNVYHSGEKMDQYVGRAKE